MSTSFSYISIHSRTWTDFKREDPASQNGKSYFKFHVKQHLLLYLIGNRQAYSGVDTQYAIDLSPNFVEGF
jgi:hypothetical protein